VEHVVEHNEAWDIKREDTSIQYRHSFDQACTVFGRWMPNQRVTLAEF
jgi:hypothetical protein